MKRAALFAAVLLPAVLCPPAPAATSLLTPPDIAAHHGPASRDDARLAALAVPAIAAVRRANPAATTEVKAKDALRWEVDVWTRADARHPSRWVAQAYVDRATGRVLEAWTGPQVAWTMARGYPGAFGRSVNSPWIFVTLTVLFVLPFADMRRPLRWLHADLLALAGLGASYAWFNDANLDLSVPVADALLAYLLVRLLAIGLGRAQPPPLRLLVPWPWLAAGALFLIGLRIGLNTLDGNVIDVGYAGVVGADRLEHGRAIYGAFPNDVGHGDTYGPLTYLAYVPFEAIWPWHGHWDDLPAAHAAAAVFDLTCAALAFVIGRGLGGLRLGVVLAYAWLAYPFTLLASNSGTNDALPAALLLGAFAVHARPLARGALGAAAGLAKVAALAVLPLLALHGVQGTPGRGDRARLLGRFATGAALTTALAALIVLPHTSPGELWDRTIGYQAGRDAPFSVWGLYGWEAGQRVMQVAAVLLAVVLPFVPRREGLTGLAALCGAVLVAAQLATSYWFYFYVLWALPAILIATLGRAGAPRAATVSRPAPPAPAPARSRPPAAAPSSG